MHKMEFEKIEKYQDLKWEFRGTWDVKNVDVVPVVVGLFVMTCSLGMYDGMRTARAQC